MCAPKEKTKIFSIILALLLGLVLISPVRLAAATLRVPQDQTTIQGAVTAAIEGDTILISDGTYNEHGIVLNKLLSLKSVNGSTSTIVDGQNVKLK